MAEVVEFTGITKLNLDPDVVLEGAKGELESVHIMGYTKDGTVYFASSLADGGEVMWLMELTKKQLLEIAEQLTGDVP